MKRRWTLCGGIVALGVLVPLQAPAYGVWASGNACSPDGQFSVSSDVDTVASGDTGPLHCAMYGVPGTPVSTQSVARADLGQAGVGTFAASDTRPAQLDIGLGGPYGHGANGYAEYADLLTFSVLPTPGGPAPGSSTTITLRVTVDGSFTGEYAHFHSLSLFSVNSSDPRWGRRQAQADFSWEGSAGPQGTPTVSFDGRGIVGTPGLLPAHLVAVLQLSGPISDGNTLALDLFQYTEVTAGSWGHGVADFMPAARLSFDLPPGWTFSPESGVLLTQVPEASTASLLLAGLLLLAAVSGRRQQGLAFRRQRSLQHHALPAGRMVEGQFPRMQEHALEAV